MKNLVYLFMFTVLALPAHAEEFDGLVSQGDEQYSRFENGEALESYKKAYAINPCSYDALMKVTRAYIDSGEDIEPKKSKELKLKKEELFLKAVEHAEKMVEKNPDKAEAYFYAAAAYGKLALFRGGKEKVKLSGFVEKNGLKAVELDPNYEKPVTTLGIYYREVANLSWFLKAFANTFFGGKLKGTNEQAEEYLLKSIEMEPDRILPHYALAQTYFHMKKKEKEIAQLKKVLELPVADHEDAFIKEKTEKRLQRYAGKK